MPDTNMNLKKPFTSKIDNSLTEFVSSELGSKYVVYKVFNEDNKFVMWSLIDIIEKKDVAHSENREEFLHLIDTIGNYKEWQKD